MNCAPYMAAVPFIISSDIDYIMITVFVKNPFETVYGKLGQKAGFLSFCNPLGNTEEI